MFLLVGTSTLSVVSIFIPGSPFITWMTNVEKDDEDLPSNIAHVTVLMTGIILARFGKYFVELHFDNEGISLSQIVSLNFRLFD